MPKLLTALVETLDRRFSDIDEGVLCATKLADMHAWPASLEDSADDFGDEYLATIVDHFRDKLVQNGVNIGTIEAECTVLKQNLYNNH
ncbi:uncharacterized protein LOC144436009 isoform X2 [Glandiceps talaboti]